MPKISRKGIVLIALWAIAQPLTLLILSSPSSAQWWQRQQPQGYNPQPTAVRQPIITRAQHAQILQLGEAMDSEGYFRNPIPVSVINVRADIPDGWINRPMEWDPQNSILLRIEGGYIIQQDFQLNP